MNLISSDESWLDVFVERTLDTFGEMDFHTLQPFVNLELEALYAGEFLENLWRVVESPSALRELRKMRGRVSPGQLSDQMLFAAINLKMAGWPKEKRLMLLDFFYQALKALHAGDVFVSTGRNCVLEDAEMRRVLASLSLSRGSLQSARTLGKLYNALYHLANGFYSDMYMGICIQNYGAYGVSDLFGQGRELVIKNAFNLRPAEVWPQVQGPFGEIKVYCVYKNAGFTTDLFSCHSQYSGDPLNGLEFWAVEADGRQLDFKEVEKIVEFYSRQSVEYWRKIASLPFEELKQKGVLIRQFAIKPLFDAAGLGWLPTEKMLGAVRNKPFKMPVWLSVPTSNREHWRKIIDPRLDFAFE